MDLASNAITAVVTLLAVTLGGWLSTRNQDRLWQRDHTRQWRDIRLTAYSEFVTAYREYIAFVQEPSAKITVVPHPRRVGEMMPFFDERGTRYREKLEATTTAAPLSLTSLRRKRPSTPLSCGLVELPQNERCIR